MRASPDTNNSKLKEMLEQAVNERDQVIAERDQAQSESERLSKEALAHKYTVQSLKDQIAQLESEKERLDH